jgi:signal peptidase I
MMAIFGMTFILQAVTVPTGSMQNTILIGDYLLVNKFIFAPGGKPLPFLPQREIVRGDIIVFKYPGNPKINPRNRQLARHSLSNKLRQTRHRLPGETVEFRNNQVFINGQFLPEHRIIGDADDNESALETTNLNRAQPNEKYSVYYSEDSMKRNKRSQPSRKGYEFGVEGKTL